MISDLQSKCLWLRKQILDIVYNSKHGHIGGALSCVEILVSIFYGGTFRVGYDRFILSKGHSCVALYPILADLGYFKTSELESFCQNGAMLGGHPSRHIPGIEIDSGSLGHGLGVGCGFALSDKLNGNDKKTLILLGDGECQEGSVAEAARFAAQFQLNNLIAIIDNNHQEVTSFIDDNISFNGWGVQHWLPSNMIVLCDIISKAQLSHNSTPMLLKIETVKGKGISFMERVLKWHHTIPTKEEYEQAKRELNGY